MATRSSSTTSCFNIISCGCFNQFLNKEDDTNNLSSQNKGPDKPRWSFGKKSPEHGKKSPEHRDQSNTVVTEKIHFPENKETAEPITIGSEPQIKSNISEKTSDSIWTEETPDSVTKNATVSTMATRPVCEEDDIKCEPVPDESESAVIVIQAAVRRFLAERRLVKHKNVVKLQAAVRGHLVRNHAVGTLRCVQAIVKMQALVRARREKGVQNAAVSSTPTHISIEKLLSNKLARQLLETTPKTKQINIKCDPSKSDSAWNWLERWMSVSSPETLESHTPDHGNTENEVRTVIPAHNVGEATRRFEEKESLVNNEENVNVKTHEEERVPESIVIPESLPAERMDLNTKPISENGVSETESKHAAKQIVTDQSDSDGSKYVFGSRKASNPAFIAAQSKFEELTSSKTNPLKSPVSSNQNDESVSGLDIGSSDPLKSANSTDQDDGSSACVKATLVADGEPDDYLATRGPWMVQNGGSECGTELSITSTLDSPDQFEIQHTKFEAVGDMNMNTDNNNNNNSNNIANVTPEKQVDQKLNDCDIELEPESSHRVYNSNDHEPVESTPSSQVSSTTKKTKTDKKVSSQTRKSLSTTKRSSPVSSSVDSGLRTSVEQLPKDPKPMKRRNSSGSPRPDHIDHEPSVPSYMQATESARAKAIANSSPRSSPDVHDKESYLKKRHSLPGAVNGRQGSPRVQRSMSQALQTTKGSSNQERKWQR